MDERGRESVLRSNTRVFYVNVLQYYITDKKVAKCPEQSKISSPKKITRVVRLLLVQLSMLPYHTALNELQFWSPFSLAEENNSGYSGEVDVGH